MYNKPTTDEMNIIRGIITESFLINETKDSLEDITRRRQERQVEVAGLGGQINPQGFENLVKGIANLKAFSGWGGAEMPKSKSQKKSKAIGERKLSNEDIKQAVMILYSAAMDHPDFRQLLDVGAFGKAQIMSPSSEVHRELVSRYPENHPVSMASRTIAARGNI